MMAPSPVPLASSNLRRGLGAIAVSLKRLAPSLSLERSLFILSLGVYALTRLWALERFPIYFFGDEAVQTLFAEQLIADRFRGPDGTLLPVYVEAAGLRWTPLLSMYFHALTMSLFGKSIIVSRATIAALSLLSAFSVGVILKKIFKARFWWVGVLMVSLTPAWFLHSRTAFETALTTTFFACFILFYLLYRCESPGYLYPALVCGAATFYTYSNAQAIVLVAAGLLLIVDLGYHLRHPATLLRGAILGLLLALPLIFFRLNHPEAFGVHLRAVASYWTANLPLLDKLRLYAEKYLYGLSPRYWFIPNQHDLPRHRMAGMGHLHIATLPLVLTGLAISLRNFRSPAYRTVLIAALATPAGAALVDIGIARVLAFIIPANILAVIGLEALLGLLKERLPYKALALTLFSGLTLLNLVLLRTALVEGPLWFKDYGLYGMQYGARQLFVETIPEYLAQDPELQILVTSTWANGTDHFLRFFFTPEERQRVRMDGIGTYTYEKKPLDENTLFVLTESEYQQALSDAKFGMVEVERILSYPNGDSGFYFARLAYTEEADQIFAAEKEARRELAEDYVMIGDQLVRLRYSQIDMGAPELMFDQDAYTLMRGLEANPFILDFVFAKPRPIHGFRVDLGTVEVAITAQLFASEAQEPVWYSEIFNKTSGDAPIEMSLKLGPEKVSRLRIEILDLNSGERAHLHLRELGLLP